MEAEELYQLLVDVPGTVGDILKRKRIALIKEAFTQTRYECADIAVKTMSYLDLDGNLEDIDCMRKAIMKL